VYTNIHDDTFVEVYTICGYLQFFQIIGYVFLIILYYGYNITIVVLNLLVCKLMKPMVMSCREMSLMEFDELALDGQNYPTWASNIVDGH